MILFEDLKTGLQVRYGPPRFKDKPNRRWEYGFIVAFKKFESDGRIVVWVRFWRGDLVGRSLRTIANSESCSASDLEDAKSCDQGIVDALIDFITKQKET